MKNKTNKHWIRGEMLYVFPTLDYLKKGEGAVSKELYCFYCEETGEIKIFFKEIVDKIGLDNIKL